MAAIHGTYNRQNTSKDIQAAGFNNAIRFEPGNNTCNVDTTDSFARKPVTKATTICQCPYPHGMNIGDILLAIVASIDCS